MARSLIQSLARALAPVAKALAPVDNRGGWMPLIRESFAGAWQRGITVSVEDTLRYWAVFRCVSIIAGDIAKMRIKLVERDGGGIWSEVDDADTVAPVLVKPNAFQTRIQFFTNWMESKLTHGNTYVLKVLGTGSRVERLIVLDPNRVRTLVSDNGDVFYQLYKDNLAGLPGSTVVVPAEFIIHDRWNTLYHPLVGLSPIYACGISAMAGLKIQNTTYKLFESGARPGGVLTAPTHIPQDTADRLKAEFEERFTGDNAGKIAVLGDGLEYKHMMMSANDSQLIEQLGWGDATVAGCYGVPSYMINAGQAPAYDNVEALNQQYYQQCLQIHIEAIEVLLDEGLGLTAANDNGRVLGTEFDLDGLLRMDTATAVKTAVEGLRGLYTPNEARRKFDLKPKVGGDTVYMQQQNFSLEALARRDAKEDPFGKSEGAAAAVGPPANDDAETDGAIQELNWKFAADPIQKAAA